MKIKIIQQKALIGYFFCKKSLPAYSGHFVICAGGRLYAFWVLITSYFLLTLRVIFSVLLSYLFYFLARPLCFLQGWRLSFRLLALLADALCWSRKYLPTILSLLSVLPKVFKWLKGVMRFASQTTVFSCRVLDLAFCQ